MRIVPLEENHHRPLYEVFCQTIPFGDRMLLYEFTQLMQTRRGFVVLNADEEVVGQIAFSDHVPGIDIRIHAFILPEYQGKWITEELCKQVFAFPFDQLKVKRVSGYCIKGLTDRGGGALEKLGFVKEGCIRKGFKVSDQFYDIVLYGMLREDCKWA